MGSETTPIALSISRYQARLKFETFLSLICASGLKCFASKVRPLRSQFAPMVASRATRASVTSPALAELSALEYSAAARLTLHKNKVKQRAFRKFMSITLFPRKGNAGGVSERHVRWAQKEMST